jgi:hypothetical protein
LFSPNFGRSYISPIKFIYFFKWGNYLIALENIFPMVYSTLQSDLICPLVSRDLWLRVKFLIWLLPLLLIITYPNQA